MRDKSGHSWMNKLKTKQGKAFGYLDHGLGWFTSRILDSSKFSDMFFYINYIGWVVFEKKKWLTAICLVLLYIKVVFELKMEEYKPATPQLLYKNAVL